MLVTKRDQVMQKSFKTTFKGESDKPWCGLSACICPSISILNFNTYEGEIYIYLSGT